MSYDDDKTTEILIPPKPLTGVGKPEEKPAAPTSNIVHVDFPRARARPGEPG